MKGPIDLGWWRVTNGQRKLLSWWPDTGRITIGDDLIAVVHDKEDLYRRLADWPSHNELRDGLGWVAQQLEGCR